MFDEASAWWSLQKEELTDSKEIEDNLQMKMGERIVELPSTPETDEEQSEEGNEDITQSPWQT